MYIYSNVFVAPCYETKRPNTDREHDAERAFFFIIFFLITATTKKKMKNDNEFEERICASAHFNFFSLHAVVTV